MLTPEETVRQKIIEYLVAEKKTPQGLIAVERTLKINNMNKRFDIVVFNNSAKPLLAIECKAPDVKLTQKTMQQLAVYNLPLKAQFLMITNGFEHLISQIDFENRQIKYLENLPL